MFRRVLCRAAKTLNAHSVSGVHTRSKTCRMVNRTNPNNCFERFNYGGHNSSQRGKFDIENMFGTSIHQRQIFVSVSKNKIL